MAYQFAVRRGASLSIFAVWSTLVGIAFTKEILDEPKVWPYAEMQWTKDQVLPSVQSALLWGNPKMGEHGMLRSFPAGTGMNALAEKHGFLVVYPAQAANANGSRCWNWFRPEDQRRDLGEPSIIAGITRAVSLAYRVDPRRVFVADMSAGASMALILGDRYPELYAAVGAHSGPPYWVANDVPSALAAMQGGAGAGRPNRSQPSSSTPTILFHGDHDRTVNASNAEAIVGQLINGRGQPLVRGSCNTGSAPGGRRFSRTDCVDHASNSVVEHWIVHGTGHAWSGGSPSGSFTDAAGPDASAEMVRFFMSQPRAVTS